MTQQQLKIQIDPDSTCFILKSTAAGSLLVVFRLLVSGGAGAHGREQKRLQDLSGAWI